MYNIWIIINESLQVVYRIISGKEMEYYFTDICIVISDIYLTVACWKILTSHHSQDAFFTPTKLVDNLCVQSEAEKKKCCSTKIYPWFLWKTCLCITCIDMNAGNDFSHHLVSVLQIYRLTHGQQDAIIEPWHLKV